MSRSSGDIGVTAQFRNNEWCHLCGARFDGYFAETDLPENAEHSDQPSRYLRICSRCLDTMRLEIVRAADKDLKEYHASIVP